VDRKLAAILAADVVAYSRLMAEDEAGTFDRLRAHRKELFEPEIAKHHGRTFKLMGDGLLAEFGSVVDAVGMCGVAATGDGPAQRWAAR
jgi:adenylate cyclase